MAQIRKVGVIGAGNMGSGIAQKFAQEGIFVVMVDMQDEYVERGLGIIRNMLDEAVQRRIVTAQQSEEILSRVQGSTDYQDVADADLVVEAVFEDKQVKSEVFRKLDSVCASDTILATNTSSFYVREFGEQTSRPERFIGLHYFYHPAKNRLLEVIPFEGTSRETVEKSLLAAKLHGKTPIVVKDAPGFAVNRFFVPFLNEAVRLLEEEVADIATIEEAARRAFKIPMGPFQLMNVTGIPIAVHAATTLGNELGPFYAPCNTLKAQMSRGEDWNLDGPVEEAKVPVVIDRLYGVCLGVAAALVDEGVATKEDTDRGAKIGLRWAMGPFEIMNRIGIDRTYTVVEDIAARYPDFQVPEILVRQKAAGRPFTFRFVDLDVKEAVATITINRPEAMNALNETVVEQLEAQFIKAEADPDVKAVVFQGAGKAFVAGADIRYFVDKIRANQIEDIVDFTRRGHELLLRIENSPKLTVALIDGLSLGGGSELALACQAIVATPAGSLGFPETGIGIYPGLGGMLRLARHVGPELAKYYVFTGSPISAADAHALGIVQQLVAAGEVPTALAALIAAGKPDKFAPRTIPDKFQPLALIGSRENVDRLLEGKPPEGVEQALAEKTAKIVGYKAPLALKAADEIIDRQTGIPIPQAVEIELSRLAEIFASADALEGLTAMGRRRPEYKGQ